VPIRDELIERTVRQLSAMLARLFRSPTTDAGSDVVEAIGAEGTRGGGPVSESPEATAAEVDRARGELRMLYRSHLGTSPELLHRLDAENLIDVLSSAGSVDGERAYLVAALFSAEARVEVAGGANEDDDLVLDLRQRALDLFLEAALVALGEPDLPTRIETLAGSVPAAERRPSTWERLHRYEHRRGEYARAEDALFGWVDSLTPRNRPKLASPPGATADADRAGAMARSFYDDLDGRTDEELRAGGLEREELAEGRVDFSSRLHALDDHG